MDDDRLLLLGEVMEATRWVVAGWMADICRGGRGGGSESFSLEGPAAERVLPLLLPIRFEAFEPRVDFFGELGSSM